MGGSEKTRCLKTRIHAMASRPRSDTEYGRSSVPSVDWCVALSADTVRQVGKGMPAGAAPPWPDMCARSRSSSQCARSPTHLAAWLRLRGPLCEPTEGFVERVGRGNVGANGGLDEFVREAAAIDGGHVKDTFARAPGKRPPLIWNTQPADEVPEA